MKLGMNQPCNLVKRKANIDQSKSAIPIRYTVNYTENVFTASLYY